MSSPADEPRIILDDDWKTRVEKEKEDARQSYQAKESEPGDQDFPPPSISVLVTTLASQALASLGQFPDPSENRPVIRKRLARHFIDTIAVLESKTAGNLSEDEAAFLSETLHQLRMIFVRTPDALPESGAARTSSLELP